MRLGAPAGSGADPKCIQSRGTRPGTDTTPIVNIELRHLRAFVVTAEELHFTRAAHRLHLRQQGLSAQIRHLEDELGVTLFRRTTRSVALTAAGQTLREQAIEILRSVDAAVAATRRKATLEQEAVTICYTPTVSGEILRSLLNRAHDALPQIRIGLCETWTPDAVSGVEDGRFDIAIARCPGGLERLAATEIRREPFGVVLGETSPLAAGEFVPLEALDDLVLAIWERRMSPTFFDATMRAFPSHAEPSRHREMERFGPETFYGDPESRREILAGRAFYATFEGHYEVLPPGFVWRLVRPETLSGVTVLHRIEDDRKPVREMIAAARALALERNWMPVPDRVAA